MTRKELGERLGGEYFEGQFVNVDVVHALPHQTFWTANVPGAIFNVTCVVSMDQTARLIIPSELSKDPFSPNNVVTAEASIRANVNLARKLCHNWRKTFQDEDQDPTMGIIVHNPEGTTYRYLNGDIVVLDDYPNRVGLYTQISGPFARTSAIDVEDLARLQEELTIEDLFTA